MRILSKQLWVTSEVGELEAVLLHRPGIELNALVPEVLGESLFDDIPWLKRIAEEHDAFAKVLEEQGCRVFYYDTLLSEILHNQNTKTSVVRELIELFMPERDSFKQWLSEYLIDLPPDKLTEVLISGLRKEDAPVPEGLKVLSSYIKQEDSYYLNPLVNLYFTRDTGVVIGDGLMIASMRRPARIRESFLLDCIRSYHPVFGRPGSTKLLRGRSCSTAGIDALEGGDVLVLSPEVVLFGCSSRSSARSIEELSEKLLRESEVKRVLVAEIPYDRAFMHLDTVFTMVDRDKFTVFPGIESWITTFSLTCDGSGELRIKSEKDLATALKSSLNLPSVRLIHSGAKNTTVAAREQWNDSANTLAVAPGRVLAYNRNEAANEILNNAGVEVLEIEGSELVRGRGGPRCMSLPLHRRED